MAAYARAATVPSQVPTEAVDAKVQEYSLTAPAGARIAPGRLQARSVIRPSGASEVTSQPTAGDRVRRGRRHLAARPHGRR